MDPGDPSEVKIISRRFLAGACFMVGWVCVWLQLRSSDPWAWAIAALMAVFALHGAVGLVSPPRPSRVLTLLTFIGGAICFLLFALFGEDHSGIVSAAFYSYLLLYSLMLRPWWDTWLVAILGGVLVSMLSEAKQAYLLPVVTWCGVSAAVSAIYKHRHESVGVQAIRELRRQLEQIQQARDADRHKLAGDFHDGPLQAFISIQLRLEVLKRMMLRSPESAAAELAELQELFKSQVSEMRSFLRDIRPVEVGEGGLASSLRHIVADFQKHSGIAAVFQSKGSMEPVAPETAGEIVQIVREALNNVQKHSRSARVAVELDRSGMSVNVTIEDHGAGFPFGGSFNLDELELLRIGPLSIQRRVRSLKGELTVESRPQHGSVLRVRIPA
jgi:signal transduction histidine kinase